MYLFFDFFSFFFNDTATTEIYTLSLHDALPISIGASVGTDANLFKIIDLSRVWIDADVFEKDLPRVRPGQDVRSEEHTSELQSQFHLVCRLLLEKKKNIK